MYSPGIFFRTVMNLPVCFWPIVGLLAVRSLQGTCRDAHAPISNIMPTETNSFSVCRFMFYPEEIGCDG